MSNDDILLQVEDLTTSFRIDDQYYPANDHINLDVYENEIVAIVGESGCGKSAFGHSIMGMHSQEQTKISGKIHFKGADLLSYSNTQLNKVRGKEISMIFQDPLTALNPLMIVGKQIEEGMKYHTKLSKNKRKQKAIEILSEVKIPQPERVYSQYPHELSGGMRQRIVIAIAIACEPSLIIADEPTTALDVTIQARIIDLLKELKRRMKTSIILITHDLGVVSEMADRIAVMYTGEFVEIGETKNFLKNPLHPYSKSLLHSLPSKNNQGEKLHVIKGVVPSLNHLQRQGCRFKPRMSGTDDSIHEETPTLREVEKGHWVRCTCYKHFQIDNHNQVVEGEKDDVFQGQ
ncbi:ABC transporter ATP-binding protein [Oceanobacillus sojae]|uniref:Nickel import system ATP-binding protein NikD n=1 Tax=Oceanobacillus sojae TaxID=582851 RepID=A0A511ZHT9_9BACI|nr:ABC transporter ATP-binding protein [Oceanobacillus sojae]GEN87012.1 peptide ABC transporter ATP-binding protein [Oceanobacillus sojae]